MQDGTDASADTQGRRGISYPFIDLPDAVARATTLHDQERRNAAPITSAVQHWGYSEKSSGGRQTIAALLQYGLAEDAGSGGERTIKVSQRLLDILFAPDPLRLEALKAAAKQPKLYAELIAKYPPHELPSDQTLIYFLIREKGLNSSAAESAVENFRSTLHMAMLDQPDAQPDPVAKVPPVEAGTPAARAQKEGASLFMPQLQVTGESHRQETFSLDEGMVTLQWPPRMSAESFEDFKAWLELLVRKIGRTVRAEPEKNKDED